MKNQFHIQHPRLAAFFDSSVLNGLIMFWALCWYIVALYPEMTVRSVVVIFFVLLLGFISYTLWFWIKKPQEIMVNRNLSDISGLMLLYLLIVSAIKSAGRWWYIFGLVSALWGLYLLFKKDKNKKMMIG